MHTLENKIALVTGAGRRDGIGAAIARRLARDGARVIVADICAPPTDLPNAGNPQWDELQAVVSEVNGLALRVDVSDSASVQSLIATAQEKFTRLDIVVNNAGVAIAPSPVVFMEEEAWRRTFDINATGTFLMCKYALPAMIDAGNGGRVINIASLAAERPKPNNSAYAASKAAVVALTRSLAQEVAAFGVTVNAILPGDIDTALKRWGLELETALTEKSLDEMIELTAARIPLKRMGTPDDVANLVAYLASDEASFITGQAWIVSGGRELT
jgi:NAD(P)-dependent dehydrogenase (short-subunit alcohol dehydrogenase family)